MTNTDKAQALKEIKSIFLLAEKVNSNTSPRILTKIRDAGLNRNSL